MIAHTKATRPTPESAAPVQSIWRATGSFESGRSRAPATIASTVSGTLTMKIDPHQKWSSRTPPTTGPSATPSPAVAGPDADRQRALAGVGEDGDQQRERRGHDERGARAHHRAGRDQPVDAARVGGRERGDAEHREPAQQRAAAPVAVPERAGQEQQPREHERVGVDHPLQLGHVRVEVTHERGERDVDDRVVDDDREQARAQHAQRRPAVAGVHDALRGVRRASSTGRTAVAAVTTIAPLEPNTAHWVSTSTPIEVVIAQPSAHNALSAGAHR